MSTIYFTAELSLVTESDMSDTTSNYHTSFIRVVRNRIVQHTACTTDGTTPCAPEDVGVIINSVSSPIMSSTTSVNFEVTFPSVMDSMELSTDLTAFFADDSSRGFGAQMPQKNGESIVSEPLHVDAQHKSLSYEEAIAAIFIVLIVLASVISTCVCGPIVCITAIVGVVCCVSKKSNASAVAPAPNNRASGGLAMVDILDAKVVPQQVIAIDCVVLSKEMA